MQNAFTGELGKSFNYRLPVSELYFQRLPNSLTLGLAATLISLLIGVPAGIISAVKVNTWWDNVAQGRRPARPLDPRLLAGAGADPRVLRLAALAADLRGRRLAARRHARARARLVLRRVDAAADALEHAGGAGQRVHQARPAQGAAGRRGHRHARVQERAHPGLHAGRRQPRGDGQRRRHHRGDLRVAGHRPAALRGHLPARLPAGAGRRDHGRLHDRRRSTWWWTSSTPSSTRASGSRGR